MATLHEALVAALDHVQAGRAVEAGILLERILEVWPEQPDALHLQGVLLGQGGRVAEAAERFERAAAQRPESADLQLNLARARRAIGQGERAAAAYRAALAAEPGLAGPGLAAARGELADVLLALGQAAERDGRPADAEAACREALAMRPGDAAALFHLGGALQDLGREEEALAAYGAALAAAPELVAARINRALLRAARGDGAGALADWRAALVCEPARERVLQALGSALSAAGRDAEAMRAARALVALEPERAKAWSDLGVLLRRSRDAARGRLALDRAVALAPGDATMLANRAEVRIVHGDPVGAEADARRAVAVDSRLVAGLHNLGVALNAQGRVPEAVRALRRALAHDPDNAVVGQALGYRLLATGALGEGWDRVELRWRIPDNALIKRDFPQPAWDGGPVGGRLLVWGEQGLGDEVMFAGLLPELAGAGYGLAVECDRRLVALFERSFPGAAVAPRAFPEPDPRLLAADIAAQVPAGSLPRLLRREMADFARTRSPYLTADAARVEGWRARLGGDGRLLVGVSWRSGNARRGAMRSLPLAALGGALAGLPVRMVSLQYGDVAADIADAAAAGVTVETAPGVDAKDDIDELAALTAAMDLVVSVDNTTVHLAGALGVPVWVLLPFAPDWRWFLLREDSPWYPTVRLFRQPQAGAWGPVLERVGAEAAALAAGDRTRLRPAAAGGAAPEEPAHAPEDESAKYSAMWRVDSYRTFSPGRQQAERFDLPGLLRQYGARSLLDAGCGSGKTSQYVMTVAPGEFEQFGFDIADNCLDPFFHAIKDRFLTVGCLWRREDFPRDYDAVVCTDVMEHIPTDKVPAVLANLRAVCRKVAYFGIALFDDVFGPMELGEPLHLTVQPPDWWLERLREAGFEVVEWTSDTDAEGAPAWLYVIARPAVQASLASPVRAVQDAGPSVNAPRPGP